MNEPNREGQTPTPRTNTERARTWLKSYAASPGTLEMAAWQEIIRLERDRDEARAELADLRHDMAKLYEADSEHLGELAALRAELAKSEMQNFDHATAISALEGELAEAVKDAQRYRWLRNKAQFSDWQILSGEAIATLDASIDAALSAQAEKKVPFTQTCKHGSGNIFCKYCDAESIEQAEKNGERGG